MKYIVKYEGSFGYIKPWTAVRDSKTKSNFYLTPSILMGIERKLFPELSINENGKLNKILRYRLSFQDISFQQENTKSIAYERKVGVGKEKYFMANTSIVSRGLLINPVVYFMFDSKEDAENASTQHICLCRNEDVLLSTELIKIENESDFDNEERFSGYESFSCTEDADGSIFCGLNKYSKDKQYIQFNMVGTPNNLLN